ncbi:hypothetical protein F5146DRAFT_1118795, partial [Armillaria mellea]
MTIWQGNTRNQACRVTHQETPSQDTDTDHPCYLSHPRDEVHAVQRSVQSQAAYCWLHRLGRYRFAHPTVVAVRERTQAASERAPIGCHADVYGVTGSLLPRLMYSASVPVLGPGARRHIAETKRRIARRTLITMDSMMVHHALHVQFPAWLIPTTFSSQCRLYMHPVADMPTIYNRRAGAPTYVKLHCPLLSRHRLRLSSGGMVPFVGGKIGNPAIITSLCWSGFQQSRMDPYTLDAPNKPRTRESTLKGRVAGYIPAFVVADGDWLQGRAPGPAENTLVLLHPTTLHPDHTLIHLATSIR